MTGKGKKVTSVKVAKIASYLLRKSLEKQLNQLFQRLPGWITKNPFFNMPTYSYGVVGQTGFFEHFVVILTHSDPFCILVKHRREN